MTDTPLSYTFHSGKNRNRKALRREVSIRFDGGDLTSDAGLVLVNRADNKLGVTAAIAEAFDDRREADQVLHKAVEIIQARVYAISLGYEDANDLNRLRNDPGLKVACGQLPVSGDPLSSQPTVSRLENACTPKDLVKMARALANRVIEQLPTDSSRIWIDIDPYDDLCHGSQQLSLFNTHYGGNCYLPMAIC